MSNELVKNFDLK